MECLNDFHTIAENPEYYAKKWKIRHSGKIVGFLCSCVPEEIILAGGALPYRIFNSNPPVSLADSLLQSYSCSIVQGALEDVLTGKLDFLEGAVFPHTCDSMQRLSDIWRINTKFDFHADLVLPVNLHSAGSGQYMIDILERFRSDIEQALHITISAQGLKEAIEVYNQIRSGLKKIYEIRSEYPELLSSADVHAIIKTSMVMDRYDFVENLSELILTLEKKSRICDAKPLKRIVVSGSICTIPGFYNLIETAGGAVVWDDLCTGSRYFDCMVCNPDDEPLVSIARRFMDRAACPSKHAGLFSRGEHIKKIVRHARAKGVLFLLVKFCDPHFFDYPYLRDLLKEEGVASMIVAVGGDATPGGQLQTKCEAFLEML